MKMTNAMETNIIIPSNRIKKFLTKLSDNKDNMKEVQHFIDEQKCRQQTMRRFVIAHLTKLKEDGIQLDEVNHRPLSPYCVGNTLCYLRSFASGLRGFHVRLKYLISFQLSSLKDEKLPHTPPSY